MAAAFHVERPDLGADPPGAKVADPGAPLLDSASVGLAEELSDELARLEAAGLKRRMRPVDGRQDAEIRVDGRDAVNLASNNYLGLAADPALGAAAIEATRTFGTGATASRLIAGSMEPHRQLEQTLGQLHDAAALFFNSGYQANVGLVSALAGPEDAIFSDQLNHASLIDGGRLSRAQVHVYKHLDTKDLAQKLTSTRARRKLVVSDTLFSMDGDLADVPALQEVAARHGAALLLDEAHAVGVLGPQGRGLAAVTATPADAFTATFGKAYGGFGAFVIAAPPIVDYLVNRARSFVFTTALPPAVAAAADTAVKLVSGSLGDERRAALRERISQFREGLARLGRLEPGAGHSPVFPLLIGDDRRTMEVSQVLLERGYFAQGIRPPTVAPGTGRLRFALMATHSSTHIDGVLAVLHDLNRAGRL
jgi:8-amino-7-oxononanoate synthase